MDTVNLKLVHFSPKKLIIEGEDKLGNIIHVEQYASGDDEFLQEIVEEIYKQEVR